MHWPSEERSPDSVFSLHWQKKASFLAASCEILVGTVFPVAEGSGRVWHSGNNFTGLRCCCGNSSIFLLSGKMMNESPGPSDGPNFDDVATNAAIKQATSNAKKGAQV